MLGAITGDIAGSTHEFHPWQGAWQDIPLFTPKSFFTDDTVLTIAVAQGLMEGGDDGELAREKIREYIQLLGHQYPNAGYGGRFAWWLTTKQKEPYNSFGNGSAMRVSPAGWAFDNLHDVEKFAAISAAVTHNHEEGIKGACAVAGSIFLARQGAAKADIKNYVETQYGYKLDRSLEDIRKTYRFDETCQGSVPEAITAFLESENFAEAIRKAIWLRGDADTQADIAGAIAEAFYGKVPEDIAREALDRLDDNLYSRFMAWQEWLAARVK